MAVTISGSHATLQEDDITELERLLGVTLPGDYRLFLLAHNGGRPTPDGFLKSRDESDRDAIDWFLGVQAGAHNDLLSYVETYRDRIPPDLLPIAHDPFGNLVCLAVAGPRSGWVYFWDHEEEAPEGEAPDYRNVAPIARSLYAFLDGLTTFPLLK